jgi:hypothetical protein
LARARLFGKEHLLPIRAIPAWPARHFFGELAAELESFCNDSQSQPTALFRVVLLAFAGIATIRGSETAARRLDRGGRCP